MGKIIFYEDRKFSGHYYECCNDCADMLCYLHRCNSIRVESGCFMIYEQPYYLGLQYFLNRGEYPEYQQWMGMNDLISSCRSIHMMQGSSYEMHLYERIEYGGQMIDLIEDCPNVRDTFNTTHIFSCKVISGNWLFFEQPHYAGRMYLIMPGEYTRFRDWGGASACVGSIKRILYTY